MIISSLVPLIIVASFGLLAPQLAPKVRPSVALWMLSAGGFLLTLCGAAAILVVVVFGAAQLPAFARMGDWSPRLVGLYSPFVTWWIWVAAAALAVAGLHGAIVARSQGRQLRAAWAVSRAAPHGLVVLRDDAAFAYAVPGWPGRIVVSRGLLRHLDGPGRRALLAHEQAHLAERHDLHRAAAVVAAALNPLLCRVPAALDLVCERRADEGAARAVADRRVVARAIAVAVRPQFDATPWAATGADVALRVQALLSPRRESRLLSALLLISVVLAIGVSTASVIWLGHDVRSIFAVAHRGL